MMDLNDFQDSFSRLINFKKNRFHPLVWINGDPQIGNDVYIGGMSEINAKGANVSIGDGCDIASFVAINCADTHKKCIGLSDKPCCKDITIEHNVFIGSHSIIKGGASIGHSSVVAAGTVVDGQDIPPHSLISGNPMVVKPGYYLSKNNLFITHNKPNLGFEEESAATKIIRSGWLVSGREVDSLENELCDFLNVEKGHVVAVSSGTAALFLALNALDAKQKNVAIPAYTCSSLRHAVKMSQACEYLVDCEKKSPNMDTQKLNSEKKLDIAIVPHMFGIPVDISKIKNIKIIEDCAQAIGAKINDTHVGLRGDCGIYSFYATKLMTTGGQGGAFVSKDKALADFVRDYINFDQRKDFNFRFNFQMTDLQAAIGREQLKKLPYFLKRREEIFQQYKDAGLELIDSSHESIKPVRYRAVMKHLSSKKIIEQLAAKGIKSIVPIEDWELLGEFVKFPNAFNLTQTTLSLPIYPSLKDIDVNKIIAGVLE